MDLTSEIVLDFSRRIKEIKTGYVVKFVVSSNLEKEFGIFAEKFFSAAHRTAFFLICEGKVDISQLDTFIFPLAFLYRHSVELFLKGIAFQSLTDDNARKEFLVSRNSHDLAAILEKVLMLSSCEYIPKEAELVWLRTYLKNISEIDKASDSFRYPFHIKQKENQYYVEKVFCEQTDIDLIKFVNKFEAVVEILRHWYYKENIDSSEWKELNPVFIELGGSYYEKSVVGYGYEKKGYFSYLNGYREVAELLFYDMKNQSTIVESFFFPMCYLYRLGVELALKSLLMEEIRMELKEKYILLKDYKHNILQLWKKTHKKISSFYDIKLEYLDRFEKCLEEITNFDNDGSAFRYPCGKNMKPFFVKEKMYDFDNISVLMKSLIYAFDKIELEISLWNEWNDETYDYN